jgi:hypothetical protein
LTEKRIAPIGKVKVISEQEKSASETTEETAPAQTTDHFLERYAGPPPEQMKAL